MEMLKHGIKRKFIPIMKRHTTAYLYSNPHICSWYVTKITISIVIPGMMKTSSIVIHLKVSKKTAIICIIDI